ncbi:MAG: mannose-1-phosphate guanylyltransferase [Eubacteriales bacterium]|nr:mannose-1-phosphate guanylyltransferase [Eubacteriales bacterium]
MKCYGVIMAGGGGTRFWPLSRQAMPKQMLNLSGRERMINETIDRLDGVIDRQDTFIVTNEKQAAKMLECVDGRIAPDHILSEPSARNTAACIGYAAMEIVKKYGDGVMCIFPSDHFVKNEEAFRQVLGEAVRTAEERDMLVTIGIEPTFPSTGYGYIRFDKNEDAVARRVEEFKEKPDLETAKAYVESGNYAWNSGMFVWKASTILKKFEALLPDIYACLVKLGEVMNTPQEQEVIGQVYPTIPTISIDYGILERSDDVLVLSGDFGWNDVGSWDMMKVVYDADENGNILVGEQVNIDTADTISFSTGRMIATVGVEGLVVVETPDAVLVCAKDRVQDVKQIVDALGERGRTELL